MAQRVSRNQICVCQMGKEDPLLLAAYVVHAVLAIFCYKGKALKFKAKGGMS